MQLREWRGWADVVSAFEASGYGQISRFARMASEPCGERFSVEEFQREQIAQGQAYVNSLFGERAQVEIGPLRSELQQTLAQMSEDDRLTRFRFPLHHARAAEASQDKEGELLLTQKDIRKFAEQHAASCGYAFHRGARGRRLTKAFGDLRGSLSFDGGGGDLGGPTAIELYFWIEIGNDHLPIDSPIDVGGVAEAAAFYDLIVEPRNLRLPPPPRDAQAISHAAKHGVCAKLRFFDLLATDLEKTLDT